MNNKETAEWIRNWCKNPLDYFGIWSWPTDGCGYEQHIRFVEHRNKNWTEEEAKKKTFRQFALEYADMIEKELE